MYTKLWVHSKESILLKGSPLQCFGGTSLSPWSLSITVTVKWSQCPVHRQDVAGLRHSIGVTAWNARQRRMCLTTFLYWTPLSLGWFFLPLNPTTTLCLLFGKDAIRCYVDDVTENSVEICKGLNGGNEFSCSVGLFSLTLPLTLHHVSHSLINHLKKWVNFH